MSATGTLARLLQGFFTDRLVRQRQASPHTIAAYRDTFRLLLTFAQLRIKKEPAALGLDDLEPSLIGAFLEDLERRRGNCARTRNARLAAIHSFFRYAALQEPAHAGLIQRVLSMPSKRYDRRLIGFLTRDEVEALLRAPDRSSWAGRRDHALLLLAIQTGLRVSELTGLRRQDVVLGSGAHVRCQGKGRKERCTPLRRETVHEAAHIFHNCKRVTVGLRGTRTKEWLLDIEYRKRETFAYSCEAYARVLQREKGPAERRVLAEKYGSTARNSDERVDIAEGRQHRHGGRGVAQRLEGHPGSVRADEARSDHESGNVSTFVALLTGCACLCCACCYRRRAPASRRALR